MWIRTLIWIVAMVAVLAILDRVLLRLEVAGWINYRRRGLSRGGPAYHVLELQAIFDPGAQQVIEAKYAEQKEEDESGDPE